MLIDSNVIIYAINADSPKHGKAKQFIEENIGNLQISHQNILETLRVLTHAKYSHPLNTSNALNSILPISKASHIISPNDKTHYVAIELIRRYNLAGNRIFDAYLVATALSNNIDTIATDNVKDLGRFKGMEIVNPFIPVEKKES